MANSLARYIDHTLLRPDAKESEIIKVCEEALEMSFKTVCVERQWLSLVVPLLKGSGVLPITVISFPRGDSTVAEKADECRQAIEEGAREIDMVLNRGFLKEKNYSALLDDISDVVDAAGVTPVKVILETSELTREEKIIACSIAKTAGARFVKTSTGFSKGGASIEDVKLMRQIVGDEMGVKASGGIRSYADAIAMIEAGADRLGTSASVAIVKGAAAATPVGAY